MKYSGFFNRMDKLWQAMRSIRLLRALLFHRVLAASEHRQVLTPDLKTVIDIGANRGQFALAARRFAPKARVVSFEPLPGPAARFARVFGSDDQVALHQVAIGPDSGIRPMHLSARDDSSSLLPIGALQSELFPGTGEVGNCEVRVAWLSELLCVSDLSRPAMLKLDVQGYEYQALEGCESLLPHFDRVYCECSFVELYSGQQLASRVIDWLFARGFVLVGEYNQSFDGEGRKIQADLLFGRKSGDDHAHPDL